MIFIGYQSALQFLLSNGTPSHKALGRGKAPILTSTQAQPSSIHTPNCKDIAQAGWPDGITTNQLHVVVPNKQVRSQSSTIASHVWTGPRTGTYLRIDDMYSVATPEACFVQLAGALPLSHLVELAMMLCGTYAPQPYEQATRYDVSPLSDPRKLQEYTARLKGKRGLDKARIAARLATTGAGSAMEAKIATMFALSTRQGGMGVPALLNQEIELTDSAKASGHHATRRPDFLWPQFNLAMDYESTTFHDEKMNYLTDEQRRNELAAMGLTSIVARPRHFKNLLAFEQLAGQVFAAMGKAPRNSARNLPEKRARLFNDLFVPGCQFDPFGADD